MKVRAAPSNETFGVKSPPSSLVASSTASPEGILGIPNFAEMRECGEA